LLFLLYDQLVRELHETLTAAGYPDIRPAHGNVFQQIGEHGARVSDMAERAQMTKQGMAELVAYLEARGYVERAPDPTDRRAKIVRLTDKGWAVVPIASSSIAQTEERWRECVGAAALAQTRAVLEDLLFDCPPDRERAGREAGSRSRSSTG
jgi:DNA-binding MarR family transcriptional regulator